MPGHSTQKSLLPPHVSGQCDCACPDGSYLEQIAPGPLIAYLEITPACNSDCVGCPNEPTFHQVPYRLNILRLDQWAMILDRMLPHLQRAKLTGGEPTLHNDFPDIVALLDDMAVPFDIFTNGRWPDPDGLVQLLGQTKHFGGCLISLHGPTADSHEAFVGAPGCFQETVRNIRLAISEGLPVVLSTIITQKNHTLIDDLLALSEEIGVSHIVFNRYVGLPWRGISPSPAQLMQAIRHIDLRRAEGHRVKFSVCIPQCFVPSSSRGCLAGTAACTVDPWGNMRPCNHAPLVVGSLLHQDLKQLWHSKTMKRWRELPDGCYGCSMFSVCRGGCQAQAMLDGNKYDTLMTKAPHQTDFICYNAWETHPIPLVD